MKAAAAVSGQPPVSIPQPRPNAPPLPLSRESLTAVADVARTAFNFPGSEQMVKHEEEEDLSGMHPPNSEPSPQSDATGKGRWKPSARIPQEGENQTSHVSTPAQASGSSFHGQAQPSRESLTTLPVEEEPMPSSSAAASSSHASVLSTGSTATPLLTEEEMLEAAAEEAAGVKRGDDWIGARDLPSQEIHASLIQRGVEGEGEHLTFTTKWDIIPAYRARILDVRIGEPSSEAHSTHVESLSSAIRGLLNKPAHSFGVIQLKDYPFLGRRRSLLNDIRV